MDGREIISGLHTSNNYTKEIEQQLNIKIGPIGGDQVMPASISETGVPWDQPQPPTALIIHDNYEAVADWTINPGNNLTSPGFRHTYEVHPGFRAASL